MTSMSAFVGEIKEQRKVVMFQDSCVKVAVMGATGTGKSAFIQFLTNDVKIHIGHSPESETSEVQTAYYTDAKTGRPVMLIDTPGFDDSREGVTDTDILQKLIDFLQPENDEGKKLNGIIYVHRISDPRVGGLARKNLRMFQALCGEKSLRNVRIVSTNWDRVTKQEGPEREEFLKQGAFQPLLRYGAQMRRHLNTAQSAQAIMAELIPLRAVSTQLQDQVADGMTLGDTDAGRVINEEIEELKKKHAEELANLKMEMEEAAWERDEALRAELDAERKVLEEKISRAEEDQTLLSMTIDTLRKEQNFAQEELKRQIALFDKETAKLQQDRARAQEDARQLRVQLDRAEKQRVQDLTDKHQRKDAKSAGIKKKEEEARRRQREMERLAVQADQNAAMLQKQIVAIEAQKRKAESSKGCLRRLVKATVEGSRQCGVAGAIYGFGGALLGEGIKEAVALPLSLIDRGDNARRVYEEKVFNPTLATSKEYFDRANGNPIAGTAGFLVGAIENGLIKAPNQVLNAMEKNPQE